MVDVWPLRVFTDESGVAADELDTVSPFPETEAVVAHDTWACNSSGAHAPSLETIGAPNGFSGVHFTAGMASVLLLMAQAGQRAATNSVRASPSSARRLGAHPSDPVRSLK